TQPFALLAEDAPIHVDQPPAPAEPVPGTQPMEGPAVAEAPPEIPGAIDGPETIVRPVPPPGPTGKQTRAPEVKDGPDDVLAPRPPGDRGQAAAPPAPPAAPGAPGAPGLPTRPADVAPESDSEVHAFSKKGVEAVM